MFDSHERQDVVEYRKKFLRWLVGLGFMNSENSPTEAAKEALRGVLVYPPEDVLQKTGILS